MENQREKQIKVHENTVEKTFLDADQKSIASLFSKDFLTEEATYNFKKIYKCKINLIYKTSNKKKDKAKRFSKA